MSVVSSSFKIQKSQSMSDSDDNESYSRSTLASLSHLRSYEGSQVRVKNKGKSSKRGLLKLVCADSSCNVEYRDGSSERVDSERIVLPSQKSRKDKSSDEYSSSSSSEEERSTLSRGDLILCKLSEESTHWTRAKISKIRSHGRRFDVKIPDESHLFTKKKRHYVLRKNIPRSRVLALEYGTVPEIEFRVGDRVKMVRNVGRRKKYRGTIRKSHDDGTYDVEVTKDGSKKMYRRVSQDVLSLHRGRQRGNEIINVEDALSGDLQDMLRRHVSKMARRGINCRQPFYDRDFNRNGIIDCEKFRRSIIELELPITERTLDLLTDSFSTPDLTSGGGVRYESFLHYIDAPKLRISSPMRMSKRIDTTRERVYPVARGAIRSGDGNTRTNGLIVDGCDRHTKPRLFVDLSS